jgi:DNA-binding NtrC family response regulator
MKARILIVDDELPLLSAISDYLTARGYECECASEAAEAMALLTYIAFDVVVTDVYLSRVPQADGFAVVSFIRDRALASRVIVMTGHDTPEVLLESRRLSADLFLRKPVPLTQLADALVAFTGTRN